MIYRVGDREIETRGEYFIAPDASVIGSVVLGDQASIWFNAVLRADMELITVGDCTNIQDCSVLHSDPGIPLSIGNRVTVGHKVMLHGCTIGDGTLVGINAVILNHARIGAGCLIGANTLITEGKEIPDGSVVMGQPGRVIRQVDEKAQAILDHSWRHYVDNAERFREGFAPLIEEG